MLDQFADFWSRLFVPDHTKLAQRQLREAHVLKMQAEAHASYDRLMVVYYEEKIKRLEALISSSNVAVTQHTHGETPMQQT